MPENMRSPTSKQGVPVILSKQSVSSILRLLNDFPRIPDKEHLSQKHAISSTLVWTGKEGFNTYRTLFKGHRTQDQILISGIVLNPEHLIVPQADSYALNSGAIAGKDTLKQQTKHPGKVGHTRHMRGQGEYYSKWLSNMARNQYYYDESGAFKHRTTDASIQTWANNDWRMYHKRRQDDSSDDDDDAVPYNRKYGEGIAMQRASTNPILGALLDDYSEYLSNTQKKQEVVKVLRGLAKILAENPQLNLYLYGNADHDVVRMLSNQQALQLLAFADEPPAFEVLFSKASPYHNHHHFSLDGITWDAKTNSVIVNFEQQVYSVQRNDKGDYFLILDDTKYFMPSTDMSNPLEGRFNQQRQDWDWQPAPKQPPVACLVHFLQQKFGDIKTVLDKNNSVTPPLGLEVIYGQDGLPLAQNFVLSIEKISDNAIKIIGHAGPVDNPIDQTKLRPVTVKTDGNLEIPVWNADKKRTEITVFNWRNLSSAPVVQQEILANQEILQKIEVALGCKISELVSKSPAATSYADMQSMLTVTPVTQAKPEVAPEPKIEATEKPAVVTQPQEKPYQLTLAASQFPELISGGVAFEVKRLPSSGFEITANFISKWGNGKKVAQTFRCQEIGSDGSLKGLQYQHHENPNHWLSEQYFSFAGGQYIDALLASFKQAKDEGLARFINAQTVTHTAAVATHSTEPVFYAVPTAGTEKLCLDCQSHPAGGGRMTFEIKPYDNGYFFITGHFSNNGQAFSQTMLYKKVDDAIEIQYLNNKADGWTTELSHAKSGAQSAKAFADNLVVAIRQNEALLEQFQISGMAPPKI